MDQRTERFINKFNKRIDEINAEMRMVHFCHFTPCRQLARHLQDDYPNGVVHYFSASGVIAFFRV